MLESRRCRGRTFQSSLAEAIRRVAARKRCYPPAMKLYEPLNVLKPVGENLWVIDGPLVRMAYFWGSIPFPTRMVIVRLQSGNLFLWSPTEPDGGLLSQVDALGPVKHLVSPNKIHYAHIGAWKRIYPEAMAWASPGVRERAASQGVDVSAFDAELGDEAHPLWRDDLDQLIFRGSRFMEEVVFFHRETQTVILADLIENFEPEKVGGIYRWLVRLAGAANPNGKAPVDLRLTFLGRKDEARASFERMLAWGPEKVIVAHGRWYDRDGTKELCRAFHWL